MKDLLIVGYFLAVSLSLLNSLSIIWLAKRVNRDLYPRLRNVSNTPKSVPPPPPVELSEYCGAYLPSANVSNTQG